MYLSLPKFIRYLPEGPAPGIGIGYVPIGVVKEMENLQPELHPLPLPRLDCFCGPRHPKSKSPGCTFVVQLGPESKPTEGRFEGWVQEVDSCRELRFRSSEELLKFLGQRFDFVMASAARREWVTEPSRAHSGVTLTEEPKREQR